MKSSLKNMVVVLFTITLISSAGVGYVNMITVEPIAAAKAAAMKNLFISARYNKASNLPAMADSGTSPTSLSTNCPFLKNRSVGILMIPN